MDLFCFKQASLQKWIQFGFKLASFRKWIQFVLNAFEQL
jgi:hypothetical protein